MLYSSFGVDDNVVAAGRRENDVKCSVLCPCMDISRYFDNVVAAGRRENDVKCSVQCPCMDISRYFDVIFDVHVV